MTEDDRNDPQELPDGCMRMGPLQRMPQLLRAAGIDPERFLTRAGLAPAEIAAPNR